jgi:GNAT superfamily N-acetyltransferase
MKDEGNLISNEYGHCNYCVCDNCAMIYDLYVKKEYRRNGHARYLIQTAIDEIRLTGYKEAIMIKAESTEDSISSEKLIVFYEEMGLKVINS